MKSKIFLIVVGVHFVFTGTALAADFAATVILSRGSVKHGLNSAQSDVKEGDQLPEGTVITTGPRSMAKVMLPDQSTLVVGPESSLKLDETKSARLSSVSVLNGQVRSKVIKDLLANGRTSKKVKFIIKTKSAVMGVRGTEFQVIYNESNKVTSLITFEGAVAMIKSDPDQPVSAMMSENLVPLLSSEKAVVVTEGRFSTVSPSMQDVTLPTRISPVQFETLKNSNLDPTKSAESPNSPNTPPSKLISPIPPGVDPKSFSSQGVGLERHLASTVGKEVITSAPPVTAPGSFPVTHVPAEGFYDKKTGAYAPPAGGFVDLKTGLYLAPPAGSAFDSRTGVYVPPPSIGVVDSGTGTYIPPTRFQLDANRGLIPVPQQESQPDRQPARAPERPLERTQEGSQEKAPSSGHFPRLISLPNIPSVPNIPNIPNAPTLIGPIGHAGTILNPGFYGTPEGMILTPGSALLPLLPPILPPVPPANLLPLSPTNPASTISTDPACPSCIPILPPPVIPQINPSNVRFSISVQ